MTKFNLTYEQLNWRRYTIKNKCQNDIDVFHQEYPATPEEAFIASGRPRFNATDLKLYKQKCTHGEIGNLVTSQGHIIFVPDENGYIEIWNHPREGVFYSIGADVAEGLIAGDYSAAFVGHDYDVVDASWYGHIDPDLFGEQLVKLAKYYNEAYIGVESNNHGLTTLKAIQRCDYWNIFYTKTYDKITEVLTQRLGWQTTSKTKPLMIDKLAEFIRNHYLIVSDERFIDECFTYIIEDNGSTNAQEGKHDDTVMAMSILIQVMLEGKGDNFIPTVNDESTNSYVSRAGFKLSKDEDEDNPNGVEVSI